MSNLTLQCQCGEVKMVVADQPIISADCYCADCQQAGEKLKLLPSSVNVMNDQGATPFVLYRKDRVALHGNEENLQSFYLNEKSSTRRVVAGCCKTPLFLEFSEGHWLSIYSVLWPENLRPKADIRTMTRSKPENVTLPNDVPNPKTHTLGFYWKLLSAWAAMGFKNPKITGSENRFQF